MNFRGSLDEVRRRVYFDPGCAFATSHVVQTQPQNAAKRTSARQRRQTGTRFTSVAFPRNITGNIFRRTNIDSPWFQLPVPPYCVSFFFLSTNRFSLPIFDFSFVHQRDTCPFARRPKLIPTNQSALSAFSFQQLLFLDLWELKL